MSDQARNGVGREPGRETDNDAHRPCGISLRPRDPRCRRERGGARCEMEKISRGSFIWFFPEMLNDELDLFSLDVRGLEDRPPLLDLGLLKGAERIGRLLFARENLVSEISELSTYGWIG